MTIQITTILGSNISSGIGAAVYAAIVSSIYKRNLKAGLSILGNLSIGGAVERVTNFVEQVAFLSENGAKIVLVPLEHSSEISSVPGIIFSNTDIPFYQNSQVLMQKSILTD